MQDDDQQDGIQAYHGSPHDFDQFDISKIGTGEGAQAYGHGLYFAQEPDIARGYRDALSEEHGQYRIGSRKLHDVYSKISDQADRLPPNEAAPLYDRLALLEDLGLGGDIESIRSRHANEPYPSDAMNWFEKEIAPNFKRKGKMYEVHINAHPDHFLDWDKPLNQQSETVKRAVQSLPYGKDPELMNAKLPHDALEDARSRWMLETGQDTRGNQKHRENVSKDLHKAGLAGIKYLDADSRTPPPNLDPDHIRGQIERNRAKAAQVTDAAHRADLDDDHQILLDRLKHAEKSISRNYVVFDDKLVNVKRKYAEGGLVS